MSMPGQHQIDAKLGNPIEHVGEISMAQKNVDRFRHHQLFNLLQLPVDVTSPLRLSSAMWLVYADQIQRLAANTMGARAWRRMWMPCAMNSPVIDSSVPLSSSWLPRHPKTPKGARRPASVRTTSPCCS